MTDRLSTVGREAMLKELREKIEELAPDAGFWMKGKPLDFTLEDLLRPLDMGNRMIEMSSRLHQGFTTAILFGTKDNLRAGFADWLLGKPLSEQSDETIRFFHSLLCP